MLRLRDGGSGLHRVNKMKVAKGHRRYPAWWPGDETLVWISGDVVTARIEDTAQPENIDHVWFSVDIGSRLPVEVSINTRSLKNALAGFDPRIRAGVVRGSWSVLPGRGVRAMPEGFEYAVVEQSENVFYEHLARSQMEDLLVTTSERCLRLEVWGMPYHHRRPGIHQIHSRRSSCAVASNVVGFDGGLKFYFAEQHATEMWMFKFCGQP